MKIFKPAIAMAAIAMMIVGSVCAQQQATLNFNANGEGAIVDISSTKITFGMGWTYTLSSVATATRDGYVFDGWYTAASGGTKLEINDSKQITNWNQLGWGNFNWNVTYKCYAHRKYEVALTLVDEINGTNVTGNYSKLPDPGYAGLTFDGWYDANNNKYTTLTPSNPAAGTTLYAKWSYKVEFKSNGATVYSESMSFTKLSDYKSIEVKENDITTPSGNFAGWFTASTGGAKITFPHTFTSNSTIYAQFGKACTITRKDYTKVVTDTKNTNSSGKLSTDDLAKAAGTDPADKIFDGWYTQISGGEKVTENTIFSSNATIYARWLYESYTVVYTTGNFPEGYTISMDGEEKTGNQITISTDENVSGSFTTPKTAPSIKETGTTIDFTDWRVRGSSVYYKSEKEVLIADVRQFAQLNTIYMDANWDCNTTVEPTVTGSDGKEIEGTTISLNKGNDNNIEFALPDNKNGSWYFRDGVSTDEGNNKEEQIPHNDIYIILDISTSMKSGLGSDNTGITRLDGAKDAIKNLLEIIVEKQSDTRVLLLTYTGINHTDSYKYNIGFTFDGTSATDSNGVKNCISTATMPVITTDNITDLKSKIDAITTGKGTPTASAMYWIKKVIQAMQKESGTSRNSYAFLFTDGEPSAKSGKLAIQVAEAINQANIIKGDKNTETNASYNGSYGVSVSGSGDQRNENWKYISKWDNENSGNFTRKEDGLSTTIYTVGMFGSSYTGDTKATADALFEGIASEGCNIGEVDPAVLGDIFSNMFSSIETETYQKIDNFVYEGPGQNYVKGPFTDCGQYQVQVQYKDGCGDWASSKPYVINVSDPDLLAPHVHLYCPKPNGVPMSPLEITKDSKGIDIEPIKFIYTYYKGENKKQEMAGTELYNAVEMPYVENINVAYYTKGKGIQDDDYGCLSQPTTISLVKATHIVDENAELSDNNSGNSGSCDVAPISGFHYVLIGDNKQSSFPTGYDNQTTTAYQNIRTGEEFVAGISTSAANIDNYKGETLNMWTAVAPVEGLTYNGKDVVTVPRVFQINNLGSNETVDLVLPLTKAEINTLWWYIGGDLSQLSLYKIDGATYTNTDGFIIRDNVKVMSYNITANSESDINSSIAYHLTIEGVALPTPPVQGNGPANLQNTLDEAGTYYVLGVKSSNLPVELLSFHAECIDHAIQFTWSTATETNNEYFTLESSEDAIHYKEIARIQGAGTSAYRQDYSFMADNNTNRTMYYRLRQTDIDGTTEVFEPIAVQCNVTAAEIALFPVPAKDYVTLQSNEEIASIQLYNVYGALVNTLQVNANHATIHVDSMAAGIYTVNITMANGEHITKKLIKH